MEAEDTSGGCVNPDCLDLLTYYSADGSAIAISYVMRRKQPVSVIITDRKRADTPEHMHFSVEDFRLFATALCSGAVPVPVLVDEVVPPGHDWWPPAREYTDGQGIRRRLGGS